MSEPTHDDIIGGQAALGIMLVMVLTLVYMAFWTTREQIQGLPQRDHAIVSELQCPYGEAIQITYQDDGTSTGVCERP